MKEILERWKAKTPIFFKRLQKIGLVIGSVAGVIATAPISLPASVVTLAGYLTVASGTIAAISQLTVDNTVNEEPKELLKD